MAMRHLTFAIKNKNMKKTKRELVEWFNLLDDDVEIEFNVLVSKHWENGKLKKIGISFV